MNELWRFDLTGQQAKRWIWRRVTPTGETIDQSRPFCFCLDAILDARAHGFSGVPDNRPPAPVERKHPDSRGTAEPAAQRAPAAARASRGVVRDISASAPGSLAGHAPAPCRISRRRLLLR
jgi:hypothetical protein